MATANDGPTVMATVDHLARPDGFTPAELSAELASGGRVVCFEYCISLIIVTLRRESGPVRVRRGRWAWVRGLPFSLISLILGWWGIPWGLVFTPVVLWVNFGGGWDVTSRYRESPGGPVSTSGTAGAT